MRRRCLFFVNEKNVPFIALRETWARPLCEACDKTSGWDWVDLCTITTTETTWEKDTRDRGDTHVTSIPPRRRLALWALVRGGRNINHAGLISLLCLNLHWLADTQRWRSAHSLWRLWPLIERRTAYNYHWAHGWNCGLTWKAAPVWWWKVFQEGLKKSDSIVGLFVSGFCWLLFFFCGGGEPSRSVFCLSLAPVIWCSSEEFLISHAAVIKGRLARTE